MSSVSVPLNIITLCNLFSTNRIANLLYLIADAINIYLYSSGSCNLPSLTSYFARCYLCNVSEFLRRYQSWNCTKHSIRNCCSLSSLFVWGFRLRFDNGLFLLLRCFFVKIQKKKALSRSKHTCETFEKSKEKKRSEAQRRPQKRMKRKRNARCYYRSSLVSSIVDRRRRERGRKGCFSLSRSFLRIFCFDFASLFSLCRGKKF